MEVELPEVGQKRIIIIGGGFGGVQLAKKLKKSNYQIVMIDKHNYHCFQPLMYQVATAALEADSIAYPIRKIYHRNKNFFFRLGEVSKIDTDTQEVFIDSKSIHYDYLVIATGAQTNYFNNEGLTISAMPMKSIKEALDLRSLILQNFEEALMLKNKRKRQSYMNFVIAGAGPTGVELAGAIGELKLHVLPKDFPELDFNEMNVYLVHTRERVLPMLSEKSSERAAKYLEKLGVELVLNTRVLDFHGDYVQTDKDDIIAKTLIWTAGVEGAPVNGIKAESINKGNRLMIDEFCRVKGYENVFAVGDVACMVTEGYPQGHPMIAPGAMQQGEFLANYFKSDLKSTKKFVYKDKGAMATIGKNKAVVEIGKRKFGGTFAWMVWMLVHLLSLVGFRNKMVSLYNWVKSYFTSDKSMRVIIQEFNLMNAKRERKEIFRKTHPTK